MVDVPGRIEVMGGDEDIVILRVDPLCHRGRLEPAGLDERAEEPGVAERGPLPLVEVEQPDVGEQVDARVLRQGDGFAVGAQEVRARPGVS